MFQEGNLSCCTVSNLVKLQPNLSHPSRAQLWEPYCYDDAGGGGDGNDLGVDYSLLHHQCCGFDHDYYKVVFIVMNMRVCAPMTAMAMTVMVIILTMLIEPKQKPRGLRLTS